MSYQSENMFDLIGDLQNAFRREMNVGIKRIVFPLVGYDAFQTCCKKLNRYNRDGDGDGDVTHFNGIEIELAPFSTTKTLTIELEET